MNAIVQDHNVEVFELGVSLGYNIGEVSHQKQPVTRKSARRAPAPPGARNAASLSHSSPPPVCHCSRVAGCELTDEHINEHTNEHINE